MGSNGGGTKIHKLHVDQLDNLLDFKAFRKQSDNDVYLRHIQNDKQFHLQKQDFELRGKKLHTIKHNMI